MIRRLVGGVVNLAGSIEYSVQIGWARISSFEWLFPLTGFGASESDIDCRILTIVAVNAAFVFVATRPAIMVLDIRTHRNKQKRRVNSDSNEDTAVNASSSCLLPHKSGS